MNANPTAQQYGCTLEVRDVAVTDATVSFTYVFHNGAEGNAYLFNLPFQAVTDEGVYAVDPALVSIAITEEKAIVSQKIVPVPPFTLVEQPVIPCVTKVEPGQTFERSLEIALPLMPQGPYMDGDEPRPPQERAERPLAFELGYFIVGEGGDDLAEEVKTAIGPALRFEPFPIDSQHLLRVDGIVERVPALVPHETSKTARDEPQR